MIALLLLFISVGRDCFFELQPPASRPVVYAPGDMCMEIHGGMILTGK
jgi:hypothetical protein